MTDSEIIIAFRRLEDEDPVRSDDQLLAAVAEECGVTVEHARSVMMNHWFPTT